MFRLWVSAETLIGLLKEWTMNKCPYCGLEARTDYPVEFRCGSVTNQHRSKACLVLEIGLLKERVADRERERDHANLVADAAIRENKSLVERVKRLEEAGDALENDNYTSDNLEAWRKAKEAKP
jgi:hypothetical protein